MKILLKYPQRLGDIVRCLPIARHFAELGAAVSFDCRPQYHPIFEAVSYCRPVHEADPAGFDRVLELAIWPDRYADYRASGLKWADFVYQLYPELAGIPRQVVFDQIDLAPAPSDYYGLGGRYSILCPFAYSEPETKSLREYYRAARRVFGLTNVWLLVDDNQRGYLEKSGLADFLQLVTVESLGHLPRLLRDAADVMISNTGPAHIAAAVRDYWHYLPKGGPQDDLDYPNAIRVDA